jgi:hypothetical protein
MQQRLNLLLLQLREEVLATLLLLQQRQLLGLIGWVVLVSCLGSWGLSCQG